MRRTWGAVLAATVLLGGCGAGSATAPGTYAAKTSTTRATKGSTATARQGSTHTAGRGGIGTCALDSLPAQARDTAKAVAAGGPFAYPRNDGVVYENRSRSLPRRERGVYREFTVKTPGASTRGTRRIITDGNATSGAPTTSPSAWYYTGDHYNTFCAITGTP